MISHKHKLIFVHINKTAGTSIKHLLLKHGADQEGGEHGPLTTFISDKTNNYFKFSFVRNPWDRFLSVYHFRRVKKVLNQLEHGIKDDISFKKFVKKIHHRESPYYHKGRDKFFLGPMVNWLKNKDGEVDMDFIGRFENLEEDIATVIEKIGLPSSFALPHANREPHPHYTTFYDSETVDLVGSMMEDDISYFGYKYE